MNNRTKCSKVDRLGYKHEYFVNEKKEFDSRYRVWYDNGKRYKEFEYKNGKKDGEYISWYPDGITIRTKCEFKNGKKEGEYKGWYEDETKRLFCKYKNGELDGIFEEWYENGKQETLAHYKDGVAEGIVKKWHKNGMVQELGMMEDDNYIGERKYWNEKGDTEEWIYFLNIGDATFKNVKNCIKGWKELTKLIETKKYRRMKRKMILIKSKISQLNDYLIYGLIMEYVSWNEKLDILKKIENISE